MTPLPMHVSPRLLRELLTAVSAQRDRIERVQSSILEQAAAERVKANLDEVEQRILLALRERVR